MFKKTILDIRTIASTKTVGIILSSILGIIIFSHYFDFSIIDPSNTAWILNQEGDFIQHYIGSVAFRLDTWHFPITKTTLLNYPEGLSIVYTDSNPLLAIISKVFKGVFNPFYQYTGIWYLLCWVLESVLGFLLIKKVTHNSFFSLISGVLFCLLPYQPFRTGHENLMGLWLILWAIYIFINDDYSVRKKELLFFIVSVISSLVHAYLCIMVLFISFVWYIQQGILLLQLKQQKPFIYFMIYNILYGILFFIILWICGYFYNLPINTGLMDFGYYSMNLNAPFNPFYEHSSSLLNFMLVRDGQYEGFQYWGVGIIVLFLFVVFLSLNKYAFIIKKPIGFLIMSIMCIILLLKNSDVPFYDRIVVAILFVIYITLIFALYQKRAFKFLLLFIPASICFLLALSNIITLNNSILFEYPLDGGEILAGFFRTIRSSGRLFWLTSVILIFSALFLLYKYLGASLKTIVILIVIISIQLVDLFSLSKVIDSNSNEYSSSLNERIKQIISDGKTMKFLGECDLKVSEFAILNHKTVNNFYAAHNTGQLTSKKINEEIDSFKKLKTNNTDDVYFFGVNILPKNNLTPFEFGKDNFLISPSKNTVPLQEANYVIKRTSDSISSIIDLIKNETIVIISVKDEATNKLSRNFTKKFDSLFATHLSSLGFRQSYLVVFKNGHPITEEIGTDKSVEFYGTLENFNIYTKSAGDPFGNLSEIKINGYNFSTNYRGLNIVSILKVPNKRNVFSLINYDTYDIQYKE